MIQRFALRALQSKWCFKVKQPSGNLFYPSHKIINGNDESLPFDFTEESYKEINYLLSKFPSNQKRSASIPVLMLAQKQNNNYLTLSAMKKVAKLLEVPEIEIFEVASFYTMFNRQPVGKYHLQVCGTTSCMICGAREIIKENIKAIEDKLGIKNGETTPDGLFTLQEVECLAACANAPMLQVNGEWVYEDLTPENVLKLIEDLKAGVAKKGPQTHRKNSEGPQGRSTLKDEVKIDRDFEAAKQLWLEKKEAARKEAEKKKEAAQKAKK